MASSTSSVLRQDWDLARLRAAFAAQVPEPSRDGAPPGVSAVLLPVFDNGAGPELLYTRRSDALRRHPGEVSFPGGRLDPGDASPLAAALREAEEEVGIRAGQVETWGHLTDFVTHHGTLSCAYVARIDGEPPAEPASRDEVSDVFTVPLGTLLDPRVYEGRRVDGMPPGRAVHYWHTRPHTVWGITGELTARFLAHATGWRPPQPPRTITDLSEFRPVRPTL
jgi:8-oxo-dGTP pyrophosphatase MutT (NUDIX family)